MPGSILAADDDKAMRNYKWIFSNTDYSISLAPNFTEAARSIGTLRSHERAGGVIIRDPRIRTQIIPAHRS